MSARVNHLNNVIIPNLKKGKIVISDRYADSTFVYQGFVNGFGVKKTMKLHKDILNNFFPNYTFVFNLSARDIVERLKKRKTKNKYDIVDKKFHTKVINGYKFISKNKRYHHIDASLSKEKIHKNILKILNI